MSPCVLINHHLRQSLNDVVCGVTVTVWWQVNEMGQMALQYGMTGYIKRLVVGDVKRSMTMSEEIASAVAGGVFVAPFASAVECVMIQQQIEVHMLMAYSTRSFTALDT